MKYIISCRQPLEFQQKAKVMYGEWNDRKGLLKLGHDFPDTEFILFLPNEEIDIRELANYDVYCHHNLICRIFNDKNVELLSINSKYSAIRDYKLNDYFKMFHKKMVKNAEGHYEEIIYVNKNDLIEENINNYFIFEPDYFKDTT